MLSWLQPWMMWIPAAILVFGAIYEAGWQAHRRQARIEQLKREGVLPRDS